MEEKVFRYTVRFKFLLILVSMLVFICSSAVIFFVTWTKSELYSEIERRGVAEVNTLAYDAKYGVLTEDDTILGRIVLGVMAKPQVTCVAVANADGTVLRSGVKDGCAFCGGMDGVPFLLPDVAQDIPDPPNDSLLLVDAGGGVIRTGVMTRGGQRIYMFAAPIVTARAAVLEYEDVADNIVFSTGAEMEYYPQTRGYVNIGLSLRRIDERIRDTFAVSVLIIFLTSIVSLCVVQRVLRLITDPIRLVANVASEISRGDLSKSVDVDSSDEIGVMAANFNRMTMTLKNTIEELVVFKGRLETMVEERTGELGVAVKRQARLLNEVGAANKDLQSFAYVVSHDLKAPLRAINSLATWISSDYGDKFDDVGREQISLLCSRVRRMHGLIEGILQYSRAGQFNTHVTSVDFMKVVRDVIAAIDPPDNIRIQIEGGELPVVSCVTTHAEQLLQNLISNAVKFIDKPNGRVVISCVGMEEYWKFAVVDNGPGIDAKYFDVIFNIFQTLTPRDQFESTGIGLAITKKIVETYGGNIWVQSRVGHGSAFYFTLPRRVETRK